MNFTRLLLKKYDTSSGSLRMFLYQQDGRPNRFVINLNDTPVVITHHFDKANGYYERYENMLKVDG